VYEIRASRVPFHGCNPFTQRDLNAPLVDSF